LVTRLRWTIAPLVVVRQGRVAIGDEIAQMPGAQMVVVLIGERPGLSAPDSLGAYLTWRPRPGVTDADRNCVSNIRLEGLAYEQAASTLIHLMTKARRRKSHRRAAHGRQCTNLDRTARLAHA